MFSLASGVVSRPASPARWPRQYKAEMALNVGDHAPDFTLADVDGRTVSLAEYRGRWVVLVFLRWLG